MSVHARASYALVCKYMNVRIRVVANLYQIVYMCLCVYMRVCVRARAHMSA